MSQVTVIMIFKIYYVGMKSSHGIICVCEIFIKSCDYLCMKSCDMYSNGPMVLNVWDTRSSTHE